MDGLLAWPLVVMARETVEQKARRYLGEGRLIVDYVVAGEIRARCRGGGAVYELGLEAGEWWRSCPAHTRCAHLTERSLCPLDHVPSSPDTAAGEPTERLRKVVASGVSLRRDLRDAKQRSDLVQTGELLGRHI